mgnify:CR=1 FL=1
MNDRIYLMRDWLFTEEFTEDMIEDAMDTAKEIGRAHV